MDLFNYFLSDLPGAPQLQRQPGSLIEVLDAALVTGLGLTVVNQISAAAGVVTIKVTGQPVALPQGLIELAGVGGALAALNGVHRVQEVGADTITIHATVADAQSTAAGMTVRIPPLGWRKKFADGAIAVYDSQNPRWYGHCLQVDTSHAASGDAAAWRGYHSMSDAHTGERPFPLPSQVSELRLPRPIVSPQPRWCVWGDGTFFALGMETYASGGTNLSWSYFGRLDATTAGDSACVLRSGYAAGGMAYSGSYQWLILSDGFVAYSTPTVGMPRAGFLDFSGFSGGKSWLETLGADGPSGLVVDLPMPVLSPQRLTWTTVSFEASAAKIFRGLLPGVRFLPHQVAEYAREDERLFQPFQVVRSGGRTLLFCPQNGQGQDVFSGSYYFGFMVDITGWRAGL